MFSAFGEEKSVYRPLFFSKFSALDTLSIHGHKVCRFLVHFVSLVFAPRTRRSLARGAPGLNFRPIIIA